MSVGRNGDVKVANNRRKEMSDGDRALVGQTSAARPEKWVI